MLLILNLLACSDALDQAACDTLDGDLHAVTASNKMDEEAASSFHLATHPHQVTLTGDTGYIWAAVASDTEASLHFDLPGVLQGLYLDGESQPLPTPEENSACAEDLAESFSFTFTEGTWHFELGGASEIFFVTASPDSDESDDHDHDH